MKVDLVFTHQELDYMNKKGMIGVAIDVLRASSTIVTAINSRCASFTPMISVEDIVRKAKENLEGAFILGGEEDGLKPIGFDLGNSPLEYMSNMVKDKHVLFCSSNGTKTIFGLKGTDDILIGSFLNVEAVSQEIYNGKKDCLIACAGDFGLFSLGDTVCGGMIISRLLQKAQTDAYLSDTAEAALILYKVHQLNIRAMLYGSEWGKHLLELDLSDDIDFCANIDEHDVVPRFRNGVIVCGN